MFTLNLNTLVGKCITSYDSWSNDSLSFNVESIIVDIHGQLYLLSSEGESIRTSGDMIYSLIAYGLYVDSSYVDSCYVTKTYKIV